MFSLQSCKRNKLNLFDIIALGLCHLNAWRYALTQKRSFRPQNEGREGGSGREGGRKWEGGWERGERGRGVGGELFGMVHSYGKHFTLFS